MNSWNEFDYKLREIAVIDLALTTAGIVRDATKLQAETDYNSAAAPLIARREAAVEEIEGFYSSNRKSIEETGRKSIELTFGRAGMRKGNPRLALRKGWNWGKVAEAIKERWKKDRTFIASLIKTKETVNKEGVKSRLSAEDMAAIGLQVKQGEEFWFETYPDKVRTEAA